MSAIQVCLAQLLELMKIEENTSDIRDWFANDDVADCLDKMEIHMTIKELYQLDLSGNEAALLAAHCQFLQTPTGKAVATNASLMDKLRALAKLKITNKESLIAATRHLSEKQHRKYAELDARRIIFPLARFDEMVYVVGPQKNPWFNSNLRKSKVRTFCFLKKTALLRVWKTADTNTLVQGIKQFFVGLMSDLQFDSVGTHDVLEGAANKNIHDSFIQLNCIGGCLASDKYAVYYFVLQASEEEFGVPQQYAAQGYVGMTSNTIWGRWVGDNYGHHQGACVLFCRNLLQQTDNSVDSFTTVPSVFDLSLLAHVLKHTEKKDRTVVVNVGAALASCRLYALQKFDTAKDAERFETSVLNSELNLLTVNGFNSRKNRELK